MGSGRRLSDYEKGQIDSLISEGLSQQELGCRINRSQKVVSNYLKNRENYGQNYGKKNRKPLTPREKRQVFRAVTNEGLSLMEAKTECGISQSKTTIWRQISATKTLKYLKRKCAPNLTPNHKKRRLEWCRKHFTFGENWKNVIFSDEKKFNLDGPDGYQYYWHDLRKEQEYFSKRAFGGKSLMIWAAIGYYGRTELAFLSGRQNSQNYKETLEMYFLPFAERIGGNDWILQQDNCTIHVSKQMKEWFAAENIKVLDWPSVSPDLNIIENMWSELSRRVYSNGRQFSTIKELKSILIEEWESIPEEYIRNLFNSMDNRLFEVIERNGNKNHY